MVDENLRELDAVVAEHVMGYQWRVINRRRKEFCSPNGLIVACVDGRETRYTGYGKPNLPEYSTDITAAMEVVEKMRTLGFSVYLSAKSDAEWCADFDKNKVFDFGEDSSLPLAICRAALAAIEVKTGLGQ